MIIDLPVVLPVKRGISKEIVSENENTELVVDSNLSPSENVNILDNKVDIDNIEE